MKLNTQLDILNIQFLMSRLMISLGVDLGKHGEEKKEKYNFWESLIATIIEIAILYCGGFFGGE